MAKDYPRFIGRLCGCKNVLITTHVRPDGDAIGTVAALSLALRGKGIPSAIVLLSSLPSKYRFILADAGLSHHEGNDGLPAGFNVDEFDGLLVADTGTWSQLPGMQPVFENWKRPKLVLDHHITQEEWADFKLVNTRAAAAAEVAAELFEIWGVEITRDIATALYVALVSDTGWFQFSNTRPYTPPHSHRHTVQWFSFACFKHWVHTVSGV